MTYSPHPETLVRPQPPLHGGHLADDAGQISTGTLPSHRSPMKSDKAVGQQIREERRAQGLTLKQLAGSVGVTGAQLHRYEVGATRIAASRLIAIADALNVPTSSFLAGASASRPEMAVPTSSDTGIDICDLIQIFGSLRSDDERRALLTVARMMAAQSTIY